VICLIVVAILTGGFSKDALGGATGGSIVLIGLMWIFFGLWSGLAVAIKRLHDRNKSGWWLLLFWLVPSLLGGVPMSAAGTAVGTLVALVSFIPEPRLEPRQGRSGGVLVSGPVAPAQHSAFFAGTTEAAPEFSLMRGGHSFWLIARGTAWAKACFCSHVGPRS
jgi:hypothetical protein